jgi:hypothetical protein
MLIQFDPAVCPITAVFQILCSNGHQVTSCAYEFVNNYFLNELFQQK